VSTSREERSLVDLSYGVVLVKEGGFSVGEVLIGVFSL
jgi:hypothetical protein